jgi:hypothetical protein
MKMMSYFQDVCDPVFPSYFTTDSSHITADNGEMCFFDWKSGHRFQKMDTTAQPGSLEAEQGVFCSTFDKTGLRLITGEADKTSMSYLSRCVAD